jgi:hypothetical protein
VGVGRARSCKKVIVHDHCILVALDNISVLIPLHLCTIFYYSIMIYCFMYFTKTCRWARFQANLAQHACYFYSTTDFVIDNSVPSMMGASWSYPPAPDALLDYITPHERSPKGMPRHQVKTSRSEQAYIYRSLRNLTPWTAVF